MNTTRRCVSAGLAVGLMGLGGKYPVMAQDSAQEYFRRRAQEVLAKAVASFPFPLIEAKGEDAFAKWEELSKTERGTPIILGDAGDDFINVTEPFSAEWPNKRSAEDIIAAAIEIRFPEDLIAKRKADGDAAHTRFEARLKADPNMALPTIVQVDGAGNRHTLSREQTLASLRTRQEPKLGEWPDSADPSPGLTVATDILTGKPLEKVYLSVIPTDDWTTIPAYLRWGDWNDNPAPEYHVAAMRLWRDRYGAELIGLSHDTMNLRVAKKPQTREEALALAREQYAYCSDIVDQGVGTLNQLAKDLLTNDWWYFWWD